LLELCELIHGGPDIEGETGPYCTKLQVAWLNAWLGKLYGLSLCAVFLRYSCLDNNTKAMEQMNRLRVFLVDDNEMTRSLLRLMIADDVFEVVGEATNAHAGMERVRVLRPDIVCLDVQMPGSDGLEMLQQIKAILPHVVVLMITASNDKATVRTAIELGAAGYVVKPFNPGTVRATLERIAAPLLKDDISHPPNNANAARLRGRRS
jgi:two-component system chemotaxis response regulator CheY